MDMGVAHNGIWSFYNDDIYELNNGAKLPFISSVTCYTAHFDNQDAFGEKFLKVPGKAALRFGVVQV